MWAAHQQADVIAEALDRKIRMEKVPYRKRAKSAPTDVTRRKKSPKPKTRKLVKKTA